MDSTEMGRAGAGRAVGMGIQGQGRTAPRQGIVHAMHPNLNACPLALHLCTSLHLLYSLWSWWCGTMMPASLPTRPRSWPVAGTMLDSSTCGR